MITRLSSWLVCLTIPFLLAACAGNPMNPAIQSEIATNVAQSFGNPHSLLGYWILEIDTREGSVEALPARTGSAHLNVTGILNTTLGVSVKGVPAESDLPNGLLALDVTLKHPFATQPKFSGFDVKGIFMTPGTVDVDGLIFAGLADTRLENADGYSRWWNPTEFTEPSMFGYIPGKLAIGTASELTATVNPYKLFCNRLQATDSLSLVAAEPMDSDMGRAVFRAGASNTRRYRIQFKMDPGPMLVFGYAIDASWMPPSPNPPVNVPDDFPIMANQPEAYRVNVKTDFNCLYRVEGGWSGGAAQFTADVYDWQGQKNGNFVPEFDDIVFYSPSLYAGGMKASLVGQSSSKATYRISIDNVNPPAIGPLQFFCGAQAAGFTYEQGPAPAPSDTLTAWQVTSVDVQEAECVADSNNSVAEAVAMTNYHAYVDGLCYGTDNADYYTFVVPFGYEFGGQIQVYSDINDCKLTIYDQNELVVFETDIDGFVTIDKQSTSLTSGTYCIKLETTWGSIPGLYAIYPQIKVTPFTITSATEVTPPNLSLDATWLAISGYGWLLLANSQFAWAYGVSDPQNPAFLSRLSIDNDGTPAYAWPYVYYYHTDASNHTEVRQINFTDPANPVDSTALTLNTAFNCIAATSWYLYVAYTGSDSKTYVQIYDHHTQPGTMQYVGACIWSESPMLGMCYVNYGALPEMLILYTQNSMAAFNVHDPANTVLTDQKDNVGVSNTFVTTYVQYVIRTDHQNIGGNDYARVYQINWDKTFLFQDYIQLNVPPSCLDAYENYFIVGDDSGINNFILTYDYSDPTDIKTADGVNGPSRPICASHTQTDLFVMRKHLSPIAANISGPIPPDYEPEYWYKVNYPVASFVSGKYIYLGCHSDYVNQYAVIDISDGPNAQVTTSRGDSAERDLFFGNSRIFASARGGAQLYCQHPNGQYFSGQWTDNLSEDISGIAASDDYMYVALKGSPALCVYFISDFPDTDPQKLPDAACSAVLTNLIVQGQALYGFTAGDMYIFDLADPDSPVEQAPPYPVSQVRDRVIFGNWMYLLMPDVMWVMDITDPLNPDFVTAVGLPFNDASCMTRLEQYLFIAAPDEHPVTVDIADPASPVVGSSPISGDPEWPIRNINVSSGHLYELCDSIGLRIFELN